MNDTTVLVTGGAGNLGREVTRKFLARGARVAVPFYKTDAPGALDQLESEFGDRLNAFALDLTTERGAEQAVRQTVEWAGAIDAVAHLVGGYAGGLGLADTPLELWDRMMDLNLKSAWLITRSAVPPMIESGGGALVFVSSRAALEGRAGRGAYSVAKAALLALVESIAEEYGRSGIRANAVLPGLIDTPANREALPDADHASWPRPADVADVIAFLASREARIVNGGAVPVYGGS
jgi:NAD(P)-dependent dehydrogenase (short-subunit alcohol dehydrogenase family)